MKVNHRVTVVDTPQRRNALSALGVKFGDPGSSLVRILWFDISEDDSSWMQVRDLIVKWNAEDGCGLNNFGMVSTEFTREELAAASFHQMLGLQKGYPQPAGNFGYLKATYNLSDFCALCGVGAKQAAPFRMKGEPKWGKKRIFQLNWVYDEYFVLPAVWEDVFRPFGVGCLPVLDHRSGNELQTVVQLEIKDTAKPNLSLGGKYPSETCASCRRTKFLPICRGFFPAFEQDPLFLICKAQEYFGSGASAWNATVVNGSVYKAIQNHKLSGVMFAPLQAI